MAMAQDTALREKIPECTYVVGQLLVRFREPVSDVIAAALIEGEGGSMIRRLHGRQLFLIGYPTRWTIEEAIEHFEALPEIEWVEPNYTRRPYGGSPLSQLDCQ